METEQPGWLSPPLKVIAFLAGAAALVGSLAYGTGLVSLYVRFVQADIPVAHALSLQDPRYVVAYGLSVVMLPALIFGAILAFTIYMHPVDPLPGVGRVVLGLIFSFSAVAVLSFGEPGRVVPVTILLLLPALPVGPWVTRRWLGRFATRATRLWACAAMGAVLASFVTIVDVLLAGEAIPHGTALSGDGDVIASGSFVGRSDGFWYLADDAGVISAVTAEAIRIEPKLKAGGIDVGLSGWDGLLTLAFAVGGFTLGWLATSPKLWRRMLRDDANAESAG